ncbi:MAG: hypothetical protein ACYTGZ_19415 [Planctomycetota bacterium]|jgi:hypothetical protein
MVKQIGLLVLLGVLVGVVTSTASAEATSLSAPFSFSFYDSCNDELVDVSGTFHIVTITSDGQTTIRLNAKGKGEGQETGRKYEWNDKIHQDIDDPDGPEITVEGTQLLRLISHGKDLNLVLDVEFLFAVDADGNVTSENVTVTDCRGSEE